MGIDKTKHFVYLTLLSAMAITLNIIESIYIGAFTFNIRIGLANIIALLTIKLLGWKETIVVNLMRVVIGNLLRGLIFGSTFWISMGGVVLSTIALILLDKMGSSLMFTSVISSLCHSVGQVLVVIVLYNQPGVAALTLPYLLATSIPMGLLTGYTAKLVLDRIKPMQKKGYH
ncbi:MAG: Gx transporter family protein [Solobacterium sp.]|nr:Gx transporter family protein [Solobacterium sp.]